MKRDYRFFGRSVTVWDWHVILRSPAALWHMRPPSDLPSFSEKEGKTPVYYLPFGWRVTKHPPLPTDGSWPLKDWNG